MPTYPHIERYHADLQRLVEFGGSDNEQSIRRAFAVCLDSYCRDHRDKLALIDELSVGAPLTESGIRPDGTVKDALRMARGYWEAKDTHDDLDAEIQAKFNRGYPRDNIVFEDSETAVLFQNGAESMRVDMSRPGELHRLISRFLDHELPEIEEFRQARQQFKTDLPAVLENLRETVAEAEASNSEYRVAADGFLELCRRSISPDVSDADVREMLLQHILTEDIFLSIFSNVQFHRENNVARQLDGLARTFFTGSVRQEAMDRLRIYYGAIGRAAHEIADYAEKQQFLKAIYEDFYQAYNPAAADRLGVVYTPNEVVDFIIRGTDWLLQKHFGKTLADDNVNILDPATGTGTFITNLINHLPVERLEHKYRNEIYANEVAILPYYIANLNIEYTYRERTGRYLEFPNLSFVDTLDNMDWRGSAGSTFTFQIGLNLGGLSEENLLRVRDQNKQAISVIIGNPPYNANQQNWNDFNPNIVYPDVDQRIRDTYVANSVATKTKQYDMYKRFIRWASDRLEDSGVIAFVTNRAYLDALQDDGFRKELLREFSNLYIIDLGGNFQRSGRGSNIFGIRIGVAVGFFVKGAVEQSSDHIHYRCIPDRQTGREKLSELKTLDISTIQFEEIEPDAKGNWFNKPDAEFMGLIPIVARQGKDSRDHADQHGLFHLYALGTSTNRDEWVYDFEINNLRDKALYFSDVYNDLVEKNDRSYPTVIKWSRDLRNKFQRGVRIAYNDANRIKCLYRPFIVKQYFADTTMNDVLTRNHYSMFGSDLRQPNTVACMTGPGSNNFAVLGSDKLVEKKYCDTNNSATFCVPLYRYTADGERVSNITEWGLRQFREHYGDDGIGAEDVFAYVYAMLHDPAYRERYEVDLRREFPRVFFQDDFEWWAGKGRELLDLHIGFESVEPWGLERVEAGAGAGASTGSGRAARVILRADRDVGVIRLDGETSLRGVPAEAWEYRLGSRSALEWVLDQYKEKKPRDPTIRERFNTYRFAEHKERVVELLDRVCAVSVATVGIVGELEERSGVERSG
ncbi:MAG: N-6 DNA methylase [Chloroflexi bacterium]|nr:N-6 DNA methylase [Chloroflexota bacterium]